MKRPKMPEQGESIEVIGYMAELERYADEAEAEIRRLREQIEESESSLCHALDVIGRHVREVERLREALAECQSEIDCYIDAEYPPDAHPHFAEQNAAYKKLNPARVALNEAKA